MCFFFAPLFGLFGISYLATRLAWLAQSGPDDDGPGCGGGGRRRHHRNRHVRSFMRGGPWWLRARKAWHLTQEALERSDLPEAERSELGATLDRGLSQIEELLGADGEGWEAGPSDETRQRVERFEADCRSLRSALAARKVENLDTSALDALGEAAARLRESKN